MSEERRSKTSMEASEAILKDHEREDMEQEFKGSKCSLLSRELTWAIHIRAMTTIEDVAQLIDRTLLLERNKALDEAIAAVEVDQEVDGACCPGCYGDRIRKLKEGRAAMEPERD